MCARAFVGQAVAAQEERSIRLAACRPDSIAVITKLGPVMTSLAHQRLRGSFGARACPTAVHRKAKTARSILGSRRRHPTRILSNIQEQGCLAALRRKGRLRALLTDIPVKGILNPRAGRLGATAYGMKQQTASTK